LTKTFKEIINGIRTAILGIEVREDIAQGMEYVERFAETSTTKAQEAAESATAAERAKTDTLAAKTEAVQAISAEKQAGLDDISTAKSNAVKETKSAHTAALQDISNARAGALDDVAASTKMATDAASTAVQKAAAAAGSTSKAAESEKNAKAFANTAQEHQTGAESAQKKAEDAAKRAAAIVSTDKTLSTEGAPADAKATGDALAGKADKTHTHDLSALINALSAGTSTPQDADYYVSQYAGGGSTTTTYHRRPMSALWAYIKSKADSVFAAKSHTHNYAGSGSAGGSANSAVKLDTATAGSATKPVYISGGKPVACTHSLGKDVPANAVFTDHTYAKMTAATASAAGKEGLVPAPAAGAQGKFLRGDGTWQAVAAKEAVDAMLAEIQAQVAKAGAPTERLAFVTQISAGNWGWNNTISCEATIPEGMDFIRITPKNFNSPYVLQFSPDKDLSFKAGENKAISAICSTDATFKYTASDRKIKITVLSADIGSTCIQGYKYGTAATPCIVWTEGDGTSAKDHDIDYIEIKERWNASSSSDYKNTVEAVARVVKGSKYTTAGGATVTFASDGTVTASEYSGTLVGYRYMTLTEVSEQLASTQSALADADALNLDQDYRLTLLELGVTDDETTA
jgi:hypothetical protein